MNTNLSVAFAPQITAAASRHHLDPRLLAAVAAQETGGPGSDSGRNIVGDGGHGHGVFQIDDRWHAFAGTAAAMDPGQNADYAAGILSSNLQRYGGDVHKALSAYNAGSPDATGTTTDWGGGTVLGYADSVLRHLSRLGGSTTAAAAAEPAPSIVATDPSNGAQSATSGITTLFGLFQQLGGAAVPGLGQLQVPPYQPIPKADDRDRDVAPSSDLGTGDDD